MKKNDGFSPLESQIVRLDKINSIEKQQIYSISFLCVFASLLAIYILRMNTQLSLTTQF